MIIMVPLVQDEANGSFFAFMTFAMLPFSMGIHMLRGTLYGKHLLLQGLSMFDVQHAQSRLESDRQFVHKAIHEWYGSTEAFTQYVRGPLRQELLESSSHYAIPLQFYPVIMLAFVSESLDEMLALYVAGAPWQNVLGHVLAHTVGMTSWIVGVLEQTGYLCYRWAPPHARAVPRTFSNTILQVFSSPDLKVSLSLPVCR